MKIGLVGAAAWLAYQQGWLSFLGLGPAPAAVAPTAGAPAASVLPAPSAAPPVPPVVGANSLDSIIGRVKTAAGVSDGLNADQWNYYLNAELAGLGKSAPDPLPIFNSAIPNFDRAQPLSISQYWGIMAPALRSQLGLSGLGIYGGLSALARRGR